MWTPLFLMNRDALCYEIDFIIDRLKEYSTAIKTNDAATLHELLKQGRILKENTKTL